MHLEVRGIHDGICATVVKKNGLNIVRVAYLSSWIANTLGRCRTLFFLVNL